MACFTTQNQPQCTFSECSSIKGLSKYFRISVAIMRPKLFWRKKPQHAFIRILQWVNLYGYGGTAVICFDKSSQMDNVERKREQWNVKSLSMCKCQSCCDGNSIKIPFSHKSMAFIALERKRWFSDWKWISCYGNNYRWMFYEWKVILIKEKISRIDALNMDSNWSHFLPIIAIYWFAF